jgi:hypothetical protein
MTSRSRLTAIPLYLTVTWLLFMACGQIDDGIYDPEFNVHGVLYSWKSIHEIIVDRTYRMDEPSEPFVNDAAVILFCGLFRDSMIFNGTTSRYQSSAHPIQPGITYEILVAKDGFDTLWGITTVPDSFSIVNPVLDTLSLTDTLKFTRSAGSMFYSLSILELTTYLEYSFWYHADSADTQTIILGTLLYDIPTSVYEISVTAYDTSYEHYYYGSSDSLRAEGVTGGVGLFGSCWTESRQFYIVTE